MTPMVQVKLRLTPEMRAAVDRERGDVPRERWLRRAVEAHLARAAERRAGCPGPGGEGRC